MPILLTYPLLLIAIILTLKSFLQTIDVLKNRKSKPTLQGRIFALAIPLLGKIKKENPWGVVYDAVTKKPIDPAVVTIAVHENGVGEYKQTRITDIEGRFSFLVVPARYVLTAEKTNYIFPSKIVTGREDGKYKNIYHGEVIEVENPYIINLNIPMDPQNYDWNQAIKPAGTNIKDLITNNARAFTITAGIALSAYIYTQTKNITALYPTAVFLFNLLFIKTYIESKLWGNLYYKYGHTPAARLKIKAIRKPANIAVASTESDHMGRYFLLLSQGNYTIEIQDEKGQTLTKMENVQVTRKKEIINFDIGI